MTLVTESMHHNCMLTIALSVLISYSRHKQDQSADLTQAEDLMSHLSCRGLPHNAIDDGPLLRAQPHPRRHRCC